VFAAGRGTGNPTAPCSALFGATSKCARFLRPAGQQRRTAEMDGLVSYGEFVLTKVSQPWCPWWQA